MSRGDTNWFEEVDEYLKLNINSFMDTFLTQGAKRVKADKLGYEIDPCPYCGHEDCFKVRTGFVKCFSAGCVANDSLGFINAVKELVGESNYIHELERFTGIEFRKQELTPERKQEIDKEKRMSDLYNIAVDYYHKELMTRNEQALRKQTMPVEKGGRGHSIEALEHFKVGFSDVDTWANLNRYLSGAGYTRDEIFEARKLIKVPPGLFVYPCFDQKDRLRRINTKMLFRSCYGKKGEDGRFIPCDHILHDPSKELQKAHEDETGHTMVKNGYSGGEKDVFFIAREDFKRKHRFKYAIIVEGENDAITTWESLKGTRFENKVIVIAIGGSIGKEKLAESPFAYIGAFEGIYEAFDHDHAGMRYRDIFNEVFVDVPYFTIPFGEGDDDGQDIDAFLKAALLKHDEFERLIMDAPMVMPPENICRIEVKTGRSGYGHPPSHQWTAANRRGKVGFLITSLVGRNNDKRLNGTIEFYHGSNEMPTDIKTGNLMTSKSNDPGLNIIRILLVKEIEKYYESFPTDPKDGQPLRPDNELLDAQNFSKSSVEIYRQLALRLMKAHVEKDSETIDRLSNLYKTALGPQKFEFVRKELNAILNSNLKVEPGETYPRIQLSSYFDTERDVALFYFSKNVQDGDAIAEVPCILSSRKTETRLDLLKRKEKTHLLLVEGRYQISSEMEAAPLKLENCSLQPQYVERWKNDQIPAEDLEIGKIVREMEEVLTDVYYFRDPRVPKVLALWAYGTYYYMMFGVYPYIELSGRRGSGKSTIDTILSKLTINGRMSASSSPAAIYRMLDLVGGTLILDEMESISDKSKNDQSDMGPVLKAGYSLSGGKISRFDPDIGEARDFECFSPKVISSINGMDEVLRDRAIMITTSTAPDNLTTKLIRVNKFNSGEGLQRVRSISSRAVLSAMTHFQKVNETYEMINEEGDANRLSQIMIPLQTIATLAGESYEKALMEYLETEIRASKQYTAENTLEGKMLFTLRRIAKELVTPEGDLTYTTDFRAGPDNEVVYNRKVDFDPVAGTFDLTTIHFKLLIDGMGDGINTREDIHTQARLLLGSHTDAKARTTRTTYTIKSDVLMRMFNNVPKVSINIYRFDIEPYLDEEGLKRLERMRSGKDLQMGILDDAPPF